MTQAIDVCELENFDLLILGLELPGIDGWETMKRLRSQWKSRDVLKIPFLLLSERSSKGDIIRAYASGVSYYTCKPCRSAEILSGIRMAIRLDGPSVRPVVPLRAETGVSQRSA